MHKEFTALLKKAKGVSEFDIVVNADIRGFSSFSQDVESAQSALFIIKFYKKLIEEYFSNASFIKPTGDGLLIGIPYEEDNLSKIANETVKKCLEIHEKFGSFFEKDPMINFNVPKKIGIGVARGAVFRIISGDKTLDCSGRPLNLASRLMELARPSGVVFDGTFGDGLLAQDIKSSFAEAEVYIAGIAEEKPIKINYTKDFTSISPRSKEPIKGDRWKTEKLIYKLRELERMTPYFVYALLNEPLNREKIIIKALYPDVEKGERTGLSRVHNFQDFEYTKEAGKPILRIFFKKLVQNLKKNGAQSEWDVTIEVNYLEK